MACVQQTKFSVGKMFDQQFGMSNWSCLIMSPVHDHDRHCQRWERLCQVQCRLAGQDLQGCFAWNTGCIGCHALDQSSIWLIIEAAMQQLLKKVWAWTLLYHFDDACYIAMTLRIGTCVSQ